MTAERNCEAVMLLGFGGPTRASEVRPFLDRVLAGRPIPRERYEEVVRHYDALGGRSPYNEITIVQSAALQDELRLIGVRAPVVVGFRNTPPFFGDVLRELKQRGIGRAFGFVLAAHRSEASWDRYLDEIKSAREHIGQAPEIEYPPSWHARPEFIAAVADRVHAALKVLDAAERARTELVFTAHSLPLSMGGQTEYVAQLNESAKAIAQVLGRARWTLAFQSRSGSPHQPWLEPDVRDVLRGLAGGCAAVIPLGFLCDHVEVLYDLDVEAAQVARDAGLTMVRAATVGEHPEFIGMVAKIAAGYLSASLCAGA